MVSFVSRLVLTYAITFAFMVVFGVLKMLGDLDREAKDRAYLVSNIIIFAWVALTWPIPTRIIHELTGISGEVSGLVWLVMICPLYVFHINVFERKIWLPFFKKLLMISSNQTD